MVYWLLLLTIIFEVAGTIAMKLSNGLTKLVPSVLILYFMEFVSACSPSL